jgi:cytoskeletal protein RodZ
VETNRVIPVAVIAIAVVSLVFFYAFRGNTNQNGANTTTTLSAEQQQAQAGSGATADPTSASALSAPSATAPKDTQPVSSKEPATIVPDNMTLDQFCKAYYDAWLKADWKSAYTMIPYQDQKGMDVNAFKQRNEQYGLTDAKVSKPAINKNAASVMAAMNLSMGMTWYTTWSFVKNDKGQWTLQDTTSAMGQQ